MTHELKILPEYFRAVKSGQKTFELRNNDRNFRTGDSLTLWEWEPEKGYTGMVLNADITYVLKDIQGLEPGYAILGIRLN